MKNTFDKYLNYLQVTSNTKIVAIELIKYIPINVSKL